MDDTTRNQIAECFEMLAAEPRWDQALWQRCFELVLANADDELVRYTFDDLIHYSGRPLFRREPLSKDLKSYSDQFRGFAKAIRLRMSLDDYKGEFE